MGTMNAPAVVSENVKDELNNSCRTLKGTWALLVVLTMMRDLRHDLAKNAFLKQTAKVHCAEDLLLSKGRVLRDHCQTSEQRGTGRAPTFS